MAGVTDMSELTFDEASAKAGWTPESQVAVLPGFIDRQLNPQILAEYLARQLEEEGLVAGKPETPEEA